MPFTKDTSIRVLPRLRRYGQTWVGGSSQVQTNSTVFKTLTRTRTGESNPRWRYQVANQLNATTPMTGIYDELISRPGRIYYTARETAAPCPSTGTIYRSTLDGHFAAYNIGTINWAAISATVAYNRGLAAYLKKARQIQVGFSSPIFLGELAQTLRMLRRPAEGLRNVMDSYLSDLMGQKRRSPKRWRKNIGKTWLEYSFGWVPFLNDIKTAVEVYTRETNKRVRIPIAAYGIEEKLHTTSFDQVSSILHASAPSFWQTKKATNRAVVRFRGMVINQVDATQWTQKTELWGFTPSEFLPTVWELLPWSFLVDYFTNIGDIISSSVYDQSNLAWTNVSSVVFQEIESYCATDLKCVMSGFGCALTAGGSASTAKLIRRRVERSTPSTLGLPSFSFELPGRVAQFANMAALFAQVSLGLHPQRRR